MASHNTSTASNPSRLAKANILEILFFLLGAHQVYAFFNSPIKNRENTMMPKFITLVLTAGALASLIEWLTLKSIGIV